MTEKEIIVLAAVAVIVLYMGLHRSLTPLDPTHEPNAAEIQEVIGKLGLACDNVDTFAYVGKDDTWRFYLARCHDGGRYVYAQSASLKQFGALTCADVLKKHGFTCPE
jgi:hypothetical protein